MRESKCSRNVQGTLDYMAPEVLRCTDRDCPDLAYGPAADIWALGVMLHELLLGKTPFSHSDALVTIKVGTLVTDLTSLSLVVTRLQNYRTFAAAA